MACLLSVQSVERPALHVNGRFRRVQILRLLVRASRTAAERHDRRRTPAQSGSSAAPETVDRLPGVALVDQPALHQQRQFVAGLQQPGLETFPIERRETQAEPLDGRRVDSPGLAVAGARPRPRTPRASPGNSRRPTRAASGAPRVPRRRPGPVTRASPGIGMLNRCASVRTASPNPTLSRSSTNLMTSPPTWQPKQ